MTSQSSSAIAASAITRLTPIAWELWCSWKRFENSERSASAIRAAALYAAGLSTGDVKWLIANELLTLRPALQMNRSGVALTARSKASSGLVLTDYGAAIIEHFCLNEVTPHWDPDARELSVSRDIIKVYRQPSAAQEIVLAAFQEDDWMRHIYDPLPRASAAYKKDAKARLRKTVEHLNRAQHPSVLRFQVCGNGECISWSLRTRVPAPHTSARLDVRCRGNRLNAGDERGNGPLAFH